MDRKLTFVSNRMTFKFRGEEMNGRSCLRCAGLLIFTSVLFTSAANADEPSTVQPTVLDTSDQWSLNFSPSGPYGGPLEIPSIVRHQKLPMRMHLEPFFKAHPVELKLDERMVPLFERALLEATDAEIQENAALSLARASSEVGIDIKSSEQPLRQLMKKTEHPRVRFACARGLVMGNMEAAGEDLAALIESADDADRLVIEPALARWKTPQAVPIWTRRLSDRNATTVALRLACDGLQQTAHQNSVPLLLSLVRDGSLSFALRMAAARAICALDNNAALTEAAQRVSGSMQDRLLSVALLRHANATANARTAVLCEDESAAVAAAAWLQLLEQNPASLLDHLGTGRVHRDSAVRETVARVVRQFPDPQRLEWLNGLLSDEHINVRNVAREMLYSIASEKPELRDGIVATASNSLRPDSKDWQGQEQSLILLGQLRASQFSEACIPLLDAARSEVRVSAAWLLHLFPNITIKETLLTRISRLEEELKTPAAAETTILELTFLFQYCGLIRAQEVHALMVQHIPKGYPGGPDKRSAAIWTLGLLNENKEPADLVAKLDDRANDFGSIPPEQEPVRRLAVVAMGLMRSKSETSEKTLLRAFDRDPPITLIPSAGRWALFLMGKTVPAELPPDQQFIGGWRLNPADAP